MEKGIDGCRCDAPEHLYETELLLDEQYYKDMNHTVDQPEVIDIIIEW